MPDGRVLQLDPSVVQAGSTRWHVPARSREDVKLGRSPVWKPVRDERSTFCIYAYVEKQSQLEVSKMIRPIDNTCDLHGERTAAVASLHEADEYSRSEVTMALELLGGESRGYWKYHVPDKKFRQAKAMGRINNEKATMLFDSGAEVSILDAAFARKVGCYIDNSQELECEGVGSNPYMAEGRTRIKITLAGSLVYYFDAWVGPPTGGQDLILGMDFMVPAGIQLDLAHGAITLPDEVRIQLAGRRSQLYSAKTEHVTLGSFAQLEVGQAVERERGFRMSARRKLWVTRGERWVPSVVVGLGKTRYLKVTNISDRRLVLHDDTLVGMWLEGDQVPRIPGFVSVGSRRCAEWQNLALQATTEESSDTESSDQETSGPLVERPRYETPMAPNQSSP
jgi:hypothetical protein